MKQNGIYFTVTDKEKRRISRNAELCGLKQGEYIRQRALGYAPKAVPPDAFFSFLRGNRPIMRATILN